MSWAHTRPACRLTTRQHAEEGSELPLGCSGSSFENPIQKPKCFDVTQLRTVKAGLQLDVILFELFSKISYFLAQSLGENSPFLKPYHEQFAASTRNPPPRLFD
ncbi:hypothetical protein PVE_R2G0113 [Pseudomonas veronii 1YdBTEX2]|uniref:Uncharacterized protein n=1 Tax=Pseudomonas veronii 1YdBTEX2 TaxID=1295141 RepID=A0A1D3K725_PSEVE|nr:hypothetical protein PVE_R2G0113 [Pseudomonas veronii 1YdBTEX2]